MWRLKKISAFLFLLVCGYFIVPAGLVHELTLHEDTADVCCDSGDGPAFGTEHHHCEILQLFIPPWNVEDGNVDWIAIVLPADQCIHLSPERNFEWPGTFVIRGPPVVS